MAKKVVIKVSINNDKEKKSILKAIAKLEGINEVSMDPTKGTLTIVGDADPVCIISSLRKKCGRCAEIDTVGPPPNKEEKKEEPKKETPKPCPPPCFLQPCRPCPPCRYPICYCYEYDTNTCSIV